MGTDKAALPIGGLTLLARATGTLALVCDEVVVVARADQELGDGAAGLRRATDRVEGAGPLAGIEAALAATGSDLMVIIPVDMPLLAPDLLRLLVATARADPTADATLLRSARGLEPFPMVLRRRTRSLAAELVDGGERRVGAFLERLRVAAVREDRWRTIDPLGRWSVNLNAPPDLAGALGSLASSRPR